MIKKYSDVLNEQLIENIMNYFQSIVQKNVWSSSIEWDQNLSLISSNILTHKISNKFLNKEIKYNVEKTLKIDFHNEKLDFIPFLYIWSGGSYITWHDDTSYPYNGTIYLNKKWNSNDGGVFLYKNHKNNEINGIEPEYNTMVVNYITETIPHNSHCVTCIVPGTIKKRITIQWRTFPIKNKKTLLYQ